MKIIEPGHVYELDEFSGGDGKNITGSNPIKINFVNREEGTEHSGTQTQEVIRALIDRTKHCDNCLRWEGNALIIDSLRYALLMHEVRALLRKHEKGLIKVEDIALGEDGHFKITVNNPSTEWNGENESNRSEPKSPSSV